MAGRLSARAERDREGKVSVPFCPALLFYLSVPLCSSRAEFRLLHRARHRSARTKRERAGQRGKVPVLPCPSPIFPSLSLSVRVKLDIDYLTGQDIGLLEALARPGCSDREGQRETERKRETCIAKQSPQSYCKATPAYCKATHRALDLSAPPLQPCTLSARPHKNRKISGFSHYAEVRGYI